MRDRDNGGEDEPQTLMDKGVSSDRGAGRVEQPDTGSINTSAEFERDSRIRLIGGSAFRAEATTPDDSIIFSREDDWGRSADSADLDDKIRPITGGYLKKGVSHVEIERHVLAHIRKNLMEVPDLVTRSSEADSIKLTPSDIKAIDNEYWFKIRFAFALGPKGRRAMFEAIDQYDLSDEEVRKLHRAGAITWDGQTLRIKASKAMMRLGWFYIALISPLAAIPLAAMIFLASTPWLVRVLMGGIGGLFCALIYIMHGTLIVPYTLGKRIKPPTKEAAKKLEI